MLWPPGASSDRQLRRVLAVVKPRCFAPPPLRGALRLGRPLRARLSRLRIHDTHFGRLSTRAPSGIFRPTISGNWMPHSPSRRGVARRGANSFATTSAAACPSRCTDCCNATPNCCGRRQICCCSGTFPNRCMTPSANRWGCPATRRRWSAKGGHSFAVRGETRTSATPLLRATSASAPSAASTCALQTRRSVSRPAHIMWHSHGGPDEVPNGLALCTFHHKAFDRGVIGLEPGSGEYRVLVSNELSGQSQAFREVLDLRDRNLRPPQEDKLQPEVEYVDWHRQQVFRGAPRSRPQR